MTEQPAAPKIFDRNLIAKNWQRRSQGQTDFITEMVLEDLADRLAPVTRSFSKAIIIGPDARLLPETGFSADGEIKFQRRSTLIDPDNMGLLDPENLKLPDDNYDLVISLLDLQSINDVPGYLTQLNRHLAPDGLMLAALLGGATFNELRSAWLEADATVSGGAYVRVAPFIDVRDAGSLLQRAAFALPVTDIETHTIRYGSPLALMKEIQQLGASNPLVERPRTLTGKATFLAAIEAYQRIAGDNDGRVRATVEIVWLSGWARHESQQKPMKPGTAQVSLTKVLKPSSNTKD